MFGLLMRTTVWERRQSTVGVCLCMYLHWDNQCIVSVHSPMWTVYRRIIYRMLSGSVLCVWVCMGTPCVECKATLSTVEEMGTGRVYTGTQTFIIVINDNGAATHNCSLLFFSFLRLCISHFFIPVFYPSFHLCAHTHPLGFCCIYQGES